MSRKRRASSTIIILANLTIKASYKLKPRLLRIDRDMASLDLAKVKRASNQ